MFQQQVWQWQQWHKQPKVNNLNKTNETTDVFCGANCIARITSCAQAKEVTTVEKYDTVVQKVTITDTVRIDTCIKSRYGASSCDD